MSAWRILVVDDEPGILRSVERVLGRDYEIEATRSPRDAIGLAAEFQPALALLDIQMPEIDGFELMDRLQALDPELAVIFMTGSIHELDAKLIRAIRKNAFYFLQKPFDRGVLLSLVERCLDQKRLQHANRTHLQRLERELGDARAFQEAMLPPPIAAVGGISVVAHYSPCFELAGDFFDYVAVPTGGAAILIADVSGHGASAAMLTGVVKSAFRSAASDMYEPVCVAQRVANAIGSFAANRFVTLICVRVIGSCLEFVNAGHPPGILARDGGVAGLLEATAPILSPALVRSPEKRTIDVRRGSDRVVLFTDGLTEAESESGDYGLERLIQEVTASAMDADALSRKLLQSVQEFSAGNPIDDDLTLVIADL
jgi:sigma-B regulation protein RsbU (phosphoserine phosphatase)